MDRAKTHKALPIDNAMYTANMSPNPTVGLVADVGGAAHAIQYPQPHPKLPSSKNPLSLSNCFHNFGTEKSNSQKS
uniref:Uncharacterized protein n=1 Tax=Leersia perrieri TaxID=77586 RepID=A0A0D9W8R4_9ORYZ